MSNPSIVRELKKKLERAGTVTVLTGAGISAESGVPTFRGSGGMWENYRIEEIATPEAFYANPKKVWEFYNMRIGKMSLVKPNPGHYALFELEKKFPHFTLITQNVDGLHAEAGSKNILEIHGNILKVRCLGCEKITKINKSFDTLPPYCSCGSLLRPHVVWFGESLDSQILNQAISALQCDVFLSIGTSSCVAPASLMAPMAKSHGAYVVEINAERTENSPIMDRVIVGRAGEILPQLLQNIRRSS